MGAQDNVDLVQRGFAAFNQADVATLSGMFNEDAVQHMPGSSLLSGDHQGRDAILGMYGQIGEETGGTFQADLTDATADGADRVVATYQARAERRGKSYDKPHTLTFTFADGKFADLVDETQDIAGYDDFWS
jgi:ketosteroid isomerase-like protein